MLLYSVSHSEHRIIWNMYYDKSPFAKGPRTHFSMETMIFSQCLICPYHWKSSAEQPAVMPLTFHCSDHQGAWWASYWKWINMFSLLLFKWPFAIHHPNTWQKWRKMSLWRFNYCREGERCLSLAATNWMGYLQNKLVFEVLVRPNRSEGGTQ